MIQFQWLTQTDPMELLRGCYATQRQLRLWVCGLCRQVWHLLTDERVRRAVEVAERYADGKVAANVMLDIWNQTIGIVTPTISQLLVFSAARCAEELEYFDMSPRVVSSNLKDLVPLPKQCVILRDICFPGYPIRPPDALWRTREIRQMATRIYDNNSWDRLPMLADRLERNGCDNLDLLYHLRGWIRCHYCLDNQAIGDGEFCTLCGFDKYLPPHFAESIHVKGCWAVDYLKEF